MARSLNNIQEAANQVLVNYPVDVEFAGFKSDTLTLQKSGWDLAIEAYAMMERPSHDVRMALRNEQAGMYGITCPVEFDRHMMAGAFFDGPKGMIEFFRGIQFCVAYLAPRIKFQVMASRGMPQFQAFDANPQVMDIKEIDLADMGIFRPLNEESEIYLPEQTIAELMDQIIDKQKPQQAEIRERQRKMQRRLEINQQSEAGRIKDYRENEIDSRREIKAQLIAV